MDRIAVLIPCYNEERTIGKVVRDFRRVLPEATVYVYDNNSTDGTARRARDAGAVVRREYAQGKGNVVRRMFREINAECYVMVDGDDTYPAEAAPGMAAKVLEEKADMVAGDRLSSTYFSENKRPFHNFGNILVRKCVNLLFGSDIKDIMTGYRAFSYLFVKSFPVLSGGFEIETEMSIHAIDKNMRTDSIVVEYRDRPEGSVSKLDTVPDGCRVLRTIGRLFRECRPSAFYGSLAVMTALLSLPLSVLSEPAACCAAVAAVCSLFSGMALDAACRKSRQDFEMRLLQVQERHGRLTEQRGGRGRQERAGYGCRGERRNGRYAREG